MVVPWPTIDKLAFLGVAGQIVELVTPYTEADPAAVLVQLLTTFGAAVDGPHVMVSSQEHRAVLHALLIGRTSGGAKGTSLAIVNAIRKRALPEFDDNVAAGLSTGEGLIELVRDATGPDDLGVLDKRLLVIESEYRTVLSRGRRTASSLGPILRQAWDLDDLRTLTRSRSALRATRPHIALIGHVTPRELAAFISDSDLSGGSINRLLLTCSRRSRVVSDMGNIPDAELNEAASLFRRSFEHAAGRAELKFSDAFMHYWRATYPGLTADRPDNWATEATARAPSQVIRLALVYALLDGADSIGPQQLTAAMALWTYCEHSARWLFSSVQHEAEGARIEALAQFILEGGPSGRTRTEISQMHFKGHRTKAQIDSELAPLLRDGTVAAVRLNTSPPTVKYIHRLAN
ncbi:hypothetical protein EB72_27730 [Mycobacterium sp. SWH-M1]|nr:hypothetical protein EB72_27730 [Mycobacterium sp. SWH-M1]